VESIHTAITYLNSSFSSSCSIPHTALLSFPTRRSSDLWRGDAGVEHLSLRVHRQESGHAHEPFRAGPGVEPGFLGQLHRDQLARSEEHTSELQSPYDLVCRLLLEKKKKKKKKITNKTRK